MELCGYDRSREEWFCDQRLRKDQKCAGEIEKHEEPCSGPSCWSSEHLSFSLDAFRESTVAARVAPSVELHLTPTTLTANRDLGLVL